MTMADDDYRGVVRELPDGTDITLSNWPLGAAVTGAAGVSRGAAVACFLDS